MQMKESHGRRGTDTEYYSWKVKRPEVFIQTVGERWLLGINHTDGTLHVLCYVDDLAKAKGLGKRLTQLYATSENYTVEGDVRLARDFWCQLDAVRSQQGYTMITTRNERGMHYVYPA